MKKKGQSRGKKESVHKWVLSESRVLSSILLVENELIVELKACKSIAGEHEAQLLGYLKTAKMEHGLLINFGSYKFKIKKFVMSQSGV